MSSPRPPSPSASKLSKFLRQNRDRSKSVTDPTPSPGSSIASVHPSTDTLPAPSTPSSSKFRKGSRFLTRRDKDNHPATVDPQEAPVIVEPVAIPRPRQPTDAASSSSRPLASAPDALHHFSSSSSATTRSIGDLPTRLSGWFSHTFSSSTTDLSLNTLLPQPSPKSKASALLTVAKHGKGHLDKAMRYLLDSDAMPDRCTEPIWLLGVQHPGYEPPSPVSPQATTVPGVVGVRGKRVGSSPSSFRSSTSSVASNADIALSLAQQGPLSSSQIPPSSKNNPAAHWPPVFYIDFVSRIWLTYRSHFSQPIKDTTLTDLCASLPTAPAAAGGEMLVAASPAKSRWHWGGEKSWSSDSGWGCMLRTGQSLLANALIHAHLGREWRKPPYPVYTTDYATYVQILTWFFDTPSPEAPFSVHRMALAGKELGTDVGQWFGPSVAAGALKRLVNNFPGAGLGVSVAKDGVLSQTDVFMASYTNPQDASRSPRTKPTSSSPLNWGDRPVLVLIGLRLGIDGVNPIYYETIKTLFTLPQSIGIAGGRPSSSYYFVGSQADNLFYLDPHNPRPAVPLRSQPPPPSPLVDFSSSTTMNNHNSSSQRRRRGSRRDKDRGSVQDSGSANAPPSSYHHHGRMPTSPASSTRTGASSNFSYHAPVSPSPLQREFSGTSSEGGGILVIGRENGNEGPSTTPTTTTTPVTAGPVPISVVLSQSSTNSTSTTSTSTTSASGVISSPSLSTSGGLDSMQEHYVTAYSGMELKTYHCERVRKMPLSGLDPSMLIGFLCKDGREWEELRRNVEDLPKSIFSIQNEHPNWANDDFDGESMMGLESMSEPDAEEEEEDDDDDDDEILGRDEDELDMDLGDDQRRLVGGVRQDDDEDEDEDEDDEEYYEPPSSVSRSTSASASASSHSRGTGTEEGDTEEDPVEALTPGPNSKFDFASTGAGRSKRQETLDTLKAEREHDDDVEEDVVVDGEEEEESDIEDGWLGIEEEGEGDVEQGVVTPLAGSTIAVVRNSGGVEHSSSSSSSSPPPQSSSSASSPRTPRSPQSPPTKESISNKSKTKTSTSHVKTKAKSDTDSRDHSTTRKKKKEKKKAVPVPIPLSISSRSSHNNNNLTTTTGKKQEASYYPFPGSGPDGDYDHEQQRQRQLIVDGHNDNSSHVRGGGGPGTRSWERGRYESQSWAGGSGSGSGGLRMFAGKGRDGGRTQSGGVKGILTDG